MEPTAQRFRLIAFTVLSILVLTIIGASFLRPAYAFTTNTLYTTVVSGSGTVSPNCPFVTPCTETVGSPITITATPASGYTFSSWTLVVGSCSGGPTSNPCILTMPGPGPEVLVSATFTPAAPIPEYPLGLPILAIFMMLAYGVIRRRTRNTFG